MGITFAMVKTRKSELGTVIHYGGNDEHPSRVGAYLIACVHFATIYDKSPVGLPCELFRSAADRRADKPVVRMDKDTADFLQKVAWDAVQEARKLAAQTPASGPTTRK